MKTSHQYALNKRAAVDGADPINKRNIPQALLKASGAMLFALMIGFITYICVGAVWLGCIESKAFNCVDRVWLPIDTFWTDISAHKSAGDQIQPGWTWEGLQQISGFYRLAFLGIWAIASTTGIRYLLRESPQKTTNAPA